MKNSLCLAVLTALSLFLSIALPVAAQDTASPSPAAEQAKALVDVLRNDGARDSLIEELERIAASTAADASPVQASQPEPLVDVPAGEDIDPEQISFGRRLALLTKSAAEALASNADLLVSRLGELPTTLSALDGARNAKVLWDAFANLAFVIAITYALFILLAVLPNRSIDAWEIPRAMSARRGHSF